MMLLLVLTLTSTLVTAASSSSSLLRSLKNETIFLKEQQQQQQRKLQPQQQSFFTYIPRNVDVFDQASIELDQRDLFRELEGATETGMATAFGNAYNIYMFGGHSKPYARILLKTPLDAFHAKGTSVDGNNIAGIPIVGELLRDAEAGSNVVEVLYTRTDLTSYQITCQVGKSTTPKLDGCFAATGNIVIGNSRPIEYDYDVSNDNLNDRTLRQLSLQSATEMYTCDNHRCPYKDYVKFINYYGKMDYADEWITSAMSGTRTDYVNHGHADFSHFTEVGRAEAMKRGSLILNIWMTVIGKLENSISGCYTHCTLSSSSLNSEEEVVPTATGTLGIIGAASPCNDYSFVNLWDEAVAYYTGILQPFGLNNNHGFMLYEINNELCEYFHTCEPQETPHRSRTNVGVFDRFVNGQRQLLEGDCSGTETIKDEIVSYLQVPLIQGVLQAAKRMEHENTIHNDDTKEMIEALGATAAAAVLPMIHACSSDDAEIVYQNMHIGRRNLAESLSFKDVVNALERNYQCLNVHCEDVGSIREGRYLLPPCTDGVPRPDSDFSGQQQHAASRPSHTTTTNNNRRHYSRRGFFENGEFTPVVQAAICIGLFLLMLFVTLLCCCTWRVPPPPLIIDENTMEY